MLHDVQNVLEALVIYLEWFLVQLLACSIVIYAKRWDVCGRLEVVNVQGVVA